MSNTWFQFKKFRINQEKAAVKVGVDSVLLGSLIGFENPENILDIGTGTGLLAFMAEQRTGADVTAIEIDNDAYIQCLENVVLNMKQESIKVLNISFQDFCKNSTNKFDHIISNPPFFSDSTKPKAESLYVAKHTCKLSFNDLVSGVSKLLKLKGIFSLIIPFDNKETFIKIANRNYLYLFRHIDIYPKKNKPANRIILEFAKENRKPFSEKVCIRDIYSNEYTEEYKQLTKEFYLDLKI